MSGETPQTCGHEHDYGGIAYRCERAPHPVDGHGPQSRHAARIDAGYAKYIGAKLERDGDGDGNGTPDLLTWEGDEPGDGENTEVDWGTVENYGSDDGGHDGSEGIDTVVASWTGHGPGCGCEDCDGMRRDAAAGTEDGE